MANTATIPQAVIRCEGCDVPLDAITIAQCSLSQHRVMICLDCVSARAKTAGSGRCSCGAKRRENPTPHKSGSRVWHTCLRCLGTTRQIS